MAAGSPTRATVASAAWALVLAHRLVFLTFEVFEVLEALNRKIERSIKRNRKILNGQSSPHGQRKTSRGHHGGGQHRRGQCAAVSKDVADKDAGLKGALALVSVSVSAK